MIKHMYTFRFVALILFPSFACVTPGPPVPVPPAVADGLNLKPNSADQRAATDLLVKLIQADTSNPPGNEGLAVAVLIEFFKTHGIKAII